MIVAEGHRLASAVVAMASVRQRSSVPKLSNALRPKHYLPKEVGARDRHTVGSDQVESVDGVCW